MKFSEFIITTQLINIFESRISEPAVILESAAEMARMIRSKISANKEPVEINKFWTNENVVKFCVALERIESVVTKQIAAKTLNVNLRDTVFSILSTADFDESTVIAKIIKQSNGQDLSKWEKILDDKQTAIAPLEGLARDISALVSQLRSNGAQTITPKATEPNGELVVK